MVAKQDLRLKCRQILRITKKQDTNGPLNLRRLPALRLFCIAKEKAGQLITRWLAMEIELKPNVVPHHSIEGLPAK